ncbi:RNA polymerase sigma factor [Listeria costaricensis]|uniref:RNA polymerase sigma factor n=1 Tax=Listeria costaricensis TaxID=2026604 RepID=UPI000C069ADF|nr:RNA polymerase sigma factor [Listeria costaricensis]
MDSDEQLIQKINNGQHELFEILIERYQKQVFSLAFKSVHHEKDAEDLAQEIFLQVYRSLGSFQQQAKFSTWLYRLSMNKCLDCLRKNGRRLEILSPELSEESPAAASPEEIILRNEEQQLAHEYRNHLPEKYRIVIDYYYFQNWRYQEIAAELGLSVKTIESRLYRAKQMMRHKRLGDRN